ncbi:flagellar hook-length control protein FliK [Rubrivivax sp. JA1026]|uniref:flagellar hook-length control protein FliK n=1 Tax=Rubrivivax sp. JA1026 TaxID=2710888 RepID=UPI0013E99600|nr:flagellar hook-length control protein FliK [Rubrivivax sp. JA1026]
MPPPAWNEAALAAALLAPATVDTLARTEGAGAAADDPAPTDDPAEWTGALQVDVLATLWRAVQTPEAASVAAGGQPAATIDADGSPPLGTAGVATAPVPVLPAPLPLSSAVATPAQPATPAEVAVPAAQTEAQVPEAVRAVPAALAAELAPADDLAPAASAAAELPPSVRTPPAADAAPALKLPAARDAWNQPLVQALGDRLRLQLGQGVEQATIRLDPPELGSIEIVVRREAGVVHVQLSASHPDVQRQLQQLGEPLRQELAQRQGAEASVEVARHGADADGRGRREQAEAEAEVGRALAEAGSEDDIPFTFPTRTAA